MKNIFFSILLLSLLIAACSLQNPSFPESTQPQLISTEQPLNEPAAPTEGAMPAQNQAVAGCLPDAALLQTLQAALSYQEVMIAPLTYGGERTFVVWFAAPALNEIPTDQAEAAAVSLAVQAAKDMLAADPCLTNYDSLAFTVVDGRYWLRFSGSIRVVDISDLLVEAPEFSGGGVSGSDSNQGGGILETESCAWAEVIETLQNSYGSAENPAVFSYSRTDVGGQVSMYWRDSALAEQSELGRAMGQIASTFSCLAPIPDGFSATITTPDGTLVATAYLPLGDNDETLADEFIFTLME